MKLEIIDNYKMLNDKEYLEFALKRLHNTDNLKYNWLVYSPDILYDLGYDITTMNFYEGFPDDTINSEHKQMFIDDTVLFYDLGNVEHYLSVATLNDFIRKIKDIEEHYNQLENRLSNIKSGYIPLNHKKNNNKV